MDRSVSVNVESDSGTGEFEDGFPPSEPPSPPPSADLGPCLYLGPAGQRCDRRATEGGFCSRHQPGAFREALRTQVPRRAIATIGVLAILWPVLVDLIRELIRFLR
jgi:hypothetical protein